MKKKIKSNYSIYSKRIAGVKVSGTIDRKSSHLDLKRWKNQMHFSFFEEDNIQTKYSDVVKINPVQKEHIKKKRICDVKVKKENKSEYQHRTKKTMSLHAVRRYPYKRTLQVKRSDLRKMVKAKGIEGFHTPEGDMSFGTVKKIKYRRNPKLTSFKGTVIRRQIISDQDKIILPYEKKGKTVDISLKRKDYMEMMDGSASARIKTYSKDIVDGFKHDSKNFTHRIAGQGMVNITGSFTKRLKKSMNEGDTLSNDMAEEIIELPYQINSTKKIVQGGIKAGVRAKQITKVAGNINLLSKNIKKETFSAGRRVRKAGKIIKAFSESNSIQKKKMIENAFNNMTGNALNVVKKFTKKTVKALGSFVVKILGLLMGAIMASIMVIIMTLLIIILSGLVGSLQLIAGADNDSILALNDECIEWEKSSLKDIELYAESLKEDIDCDYGRYEESYSFIISAEEMDDVGDLWQEDIVIPYEGAINEGPDIPGIVDSWELLEPNIENSWLPVYVLTCTYFNYDVGKLGGSEEEMNVYSKEEILSIAKEFYNVMYDSLREERSVTMLCYEEELEMYDSDGDGIEDTVEIVIHEHGYNYYGVFAAIRSFEETLALMPWNTNARSYCSKFEADFSTMEPNEQAECIRSLPEKKDKEARDFYAELVHNMVTAEENVVGEVSEEWKNLLSIGSVYDDMSTEELENAYESFPVIQMKREEFVELVKEYCEPTGKIPYLFGGKSTESGWNSTVANGLDCTGFVDWVYRTAGEEVLQNGPGEMWYSTYSIRETELLPGDLVWKSQPYESAVTHVGIFLGYDENGNKLFGHCASGTGTVVNSYKGFTFYRKACVRFLDDTEK